MKGLLLHPRTGRPESLYGYVNPEIDHERELHRAPQHVKDSLRRAAELSGPYEPRASAGTSWEEVIYRATADQTQVLNTTSEADMLTAGEVPVIQPGYMQVGRVLCWTIWGRSTTVATTPGTIIFRLRWGTLAAGTVLVASKAQRPKTTTSTNMAVWMQIILTCRAVGATGSAFAMGQSQLANTIGDAASIQEAVWPDAPAAVTFDTTTAAVACRPTIQHSVATATTAWTTHMAKLESMN